MGGWLVVCDESDSIWQLRSELIRCKVRFLLLRSLLKHSRGAVSEFDSLSADDSVSEFECFQTFLYSNLSTSTLISFPCADAA